MENILEQLYHGKLFPAEQYSPKGKDHWKSSLEHLKHCEDFTETLSRLDPPLDKQFNDIMAEQLEDLSDELPEMFINGFRLGAKMMAEIYKNE